jgi:hypothetical protein
MLRKTVKMGCEVEWLIGYRDLHFFCNLCLMFFFVFILGFCVICVLVFKVAELR